MKPAKYRNEYLTDMTRWDEGCAFIKLYNNTAPVLTEYFHAHPEDFFKFCIVRQFKFLFEIDFSDNQLYLVFNQYQYEAVRVLQLLCSETDSAYLSSAKIRSQALKIYDILPENLQAQVQVPL